MSYLRLYEYPATQAKHFRVIGFKGFRHVPPEKKGEGSEVEAKFDESLCRSRRFIRDLILCNHFDYFCTFTFADPEMRFDYLDCKKALLKFFGNFKNRYAPAFRYVVVPEQHKNGAWHFHGVVSGLPFSEFSVPKYITVRDRFTQQLKEVTNTQKYIRWDRYAERFGHFDCSKIKQYEACAAYVSKYITKSLSGMVKGRHLFFASQGLQRPSLVFDADEVPFPFKTAEYEDEFCRIAWARSDQVVGSLLPVWYGEQCADLRDSADLPRDMSRGQLEEYIFEPLRLPDL